MGAAVLNPFITRLKSMVLQSGLKTAGSKSATHFGAIKSRARKNSMHKIASTGVIGSAQSIRKGEITVEESSSGKSECAMTGGTVYRESLCEGDDIELRRALER